MSWMQKLYETYERCAGGEPDGLEPLLPICHTTQQAHIEVVLDATGIFRRASVLVDQNSRNTMIPCTEESAGRSGKKPTCHPLCDKLQYVAGDYLEYGGEVTSGFEGDPSEPHRTFLNGLCKWVESANGHPKLNAILSYVKKGQVVADLVREKVLPVGDDGRLTRTWEGAKESAPAIFKVMLNTQSPAEAFVRWRVEESAVESSGTWEDPQLVDSWISFYKSVQTKHGYCMVGGNETSLAMQHPAKLRSGADKAKLISSNDTSGFTFRGRLLEADDAATVSFEVTQKAHNALRWLIQNQAYRNGGQAIVSWAVSGKPLPDPLKNTLELFGHASVAMDTVPADPGQAFAMLLASAIRGYRARLDPSEHIVVMGLESATPGRMGITYYRELQGSEFLDRIEAWHRDYAWPQNFGKDKHFVGAPAPRDIGEAAFGRRLDENLRKATIERLLPCIVDRAQMPSDLVRSTTQRAAGRAGLDGQEWEKVLGISCALYKGYHVERNYKMALEPTRRSRDYLYGRLLAVADNIERYALSVGAEKPRETTAARLMQRFADRPGSTWRTIELALRPYMTRLRAGERSGGFLVKRERLLDEITDAFEATDFVSDARLSGEFLLGFHCQRQVWRRPIESTSEVELNSTDPTGDN